VKELVVTFGAKIFSVNSLVRLRCASASDAGLLVTKMSAGEANYSYNDYGAALKSRNRQVRMGEALTSVYSRLSNQNRKDLKETASTLAADGSLRAARNLYRVHESIWEVCPVPLPLRLHPRLRDCKASMSISLNFKTDEWLCDAARRAAEGESGEDEKMVLYRYLLENGAVISRKVLSVVRRSPVLKDHRDRWVAPDGLVLLPRAQLDLLEPVISAPSEDVIKANELVNRLRIREKLLGEDLVRLARHVADTSNRVDAFEQFLAKNLVLLSPRTVAQLRSIPFLRASSGKLGEPQRLHIRTPTNVACIEDDDAFVGGNSNNLYRRLGCPGLPMSEALLNSLQLRRSQNTEPPRLD
jgi:hypothetical protein